MCNLAAASSNTIQGITEMGGKVYLWYKTGGVVKLKQYATDLSGATDITDFNTTDDSTFDLTTDSAGTKLWLTGCNNNGKKLHNFGISCNISRYNYIRRSNISKQ